MLPINPKNIVWFHPYQPPKTGLIEKNKKTAVTETVRPTLQKMQKILSVPIDRQFLVNAWKSKDLEQIRLCLETKGSSFGRDTLGNLLIQGAEEGFESGIAMLLDKDFSLVTYAIPDKENSKISHITALHTAAAAGRRDTCSLLLRRGADPEARTLILTGYQWDKNREQKPGDTYVEYGLKKRTDRGFNDLAKYAANRHHNKTETDWEIFKEININERSMNVYDSSLFGRTQTVLEFFIKSCSIFDPGSERDVCREEIECERTEEVIEFLLQMGADPGLPDEEGVSILDWINVPYQYERNIFRSTYYSFFNDVFCEAYIQRIIQRMERAKAHIRASTPHVISHVITDYAEIPEFSQSFLVIKKIVTKQLQG